MPLVILLTHPTFRSNQTTDILILFSLKSHTLTPQYLCAKPVTKPLLGQVSAAVSSFRKPALPALGLVPFLLPLPRRCPSLSAACTAPHGLLLPPPGRGAPDGGAEEGCDGLHPLSLATFAGLSPAGRGRDS